MTKNMVKEILDIINDNDQIIGQASHKEVHDKKILHRVAAMLFDSSGKVLLQLRASNKSAYPLHWSFSMGGHVRHGESYMSGLIREAKEEVGISVSEKDFSFKGEGTFVEHSGAHVLYRLYEITYDGPIEEKTEEVDSVQFVDFSILKHMIEEKKEKLHPQMVYVLQKQYKSELATDV